MEKIIQFDEKLVKEAIEKFLGPKRGNLYVFDNECKTYVRFFNENELRRRLGIENEIDLEPFFKKFLEYGYIIRKDEMMKKYSISRCSWLIESPATPVTTKCFEKDLPIEWKKVRILE